MIVTTLKRTSKARSKDGDRRLRPIQKTIRFTEEEWDVIEQEMRIRKMDWQEYCIFAAIAMIRGER